MADPAAEAGAWPPVPLLRAALLCRCPRCGKGPVFKGLLDIRPTCPVCGLDLAANDSGDGPAVFAIFILGAVFVILAFWVEFRFEPPLWVHAVLWSALMPPAAIGVMRPAKAALLALAYRHRIAGFARR
jgi:uncharacterized protein (DUF983 family)